MKDRPLNGESAMFRQLEDLLRERITSGALATGDRVPSIAELCAEYQVSAITARRALTDLVQEGLLTSIQGKGTFVAARPPSAKSGALIGVIFPDLAQSPFFSSMHQGIESVLGDRLQIVASSHLDPNHESTLLDDLMARGINHVLFTPVTGSDRTSADAAIRRLVAAGLHLVAIDRGIAGPGLIDLVSSDNVAVGRLATRHCRDLGHQRIAFVWAHPCGTFADRQTGYEQTLREDGLTPDPLLARGGGTAPYEESGYFRTLELFHLAQPPTAIIAGNELIALGVLRACRFLGLSVPGRVSVVSIDDTLANLATPPLTAVHQPTMAMGRRAAEMLLERAAGLTTPPRHVQLPVSLVIRESTGPAPT